MEETVLTESKPKKVLLFFGGSISLVLGTIGIFLPILPTTPFLLLSAGCYFKSSKMAYQWLLRNKIFGKFIRDYRAGKGISVKVKVFTIFMLWLTITISIFFIVLVWVQTLLLVIAVAVSIHIILIKARSKETP